MFSDKERRGLEQVKLKHDAVLALGVSDEGVATGVQVHLGEVW